MEIVFILQKFVGEIFNSVEIQSIQSKLLEETGGAIMN